MLTIKFVYEAYTTELAYIFCMHTCNLNSIKECNFKN